MIKYNNGSYYHKANGSMVTVLKNRTGMGQEHTGTRGGGYLRGAMGTPQPSRGATGASQAGSLYPSLTGSRAPGTPSRGIQATRLLIVMFCKVNLVIGQGVPICYILTGHKGHPPGTCTKAIVSHRRVACSKGLHW